MLGFSENNLFIFFTSSGENQSVISIFSACGAGCISVSGIIIIIE